MAQLSIEFTRDTLADAFYLGVDVLSGVDVDPVCLVVTNGFRNHVERLTRIATLNDLTGIPDAPVVSGYNHFFESGFSTLTPVATDLIVLNEVPSLWTYLGYVPGTQHEVDSFDPAYDVAKVVIGDEFPAYGGRLSFTLYDSGLTPKGVFNGSGAATLDVYDGSWDEQPYYRMQSIHASIPDLATAINKFISLQTEAQSLVDNTETYLDEYAGTSTEIYT